ncbi:MAG TPA: twin-arginine translocation signal domain-containing protein [Thermoflexia bacterium]|jgi:hypothetical protein|nr:twin-arginine translocation signal domain-containing protein [Thermoflexia bacterium]
MADEKRLKTVSRRDFLTGAGILIAGGTLGLVGCGPKQEPAEAALEIPAWPWPYVKLDPEDVRKRAHKGYYEGA